MEYDFFKLKFCYFFCMKQEICAGFWSALDGKNKCVQKFNLTMPLKYTIFWKYRCGWKQEIRADICFEKCHQNNIFGNVNAGATKKYVQKFSSKMPLKITFFFLEMWVLLETRNTYKNLIWKGHWNIMYIFFFLNLVVRNEFSLDDLTKLLLER